jgi:hypothetical protein
VEFETPGSLESPEGLAVSEVPVGVGYLEARAKYEGFLGVLEKFENIAIPGTAASSGRV